VLICALGQHLAHLCRLETYFLELPLQFEEEGSLVIRRSRAPVFAAWGGVAQAGLHPPWRDFRERWWTRRVCSGVARCEKVSRADPKRERGSFGRRPLVGERGDDLLEDLVVEIILRPAWDLFRLDLLAELGRAYAREEGERGAEDNRERPTFMAAAQPQAQDRGRNKARLRGLFEIEQYTGRARRETRKSSRRENVCDDHGQKGRVAGAAGPAHASTDDRA
jgi:hypothetical protein